jgi:hypothetical protein
LSIPPASCGASGRIFPVAGHRREHKRCHSPRKRESRAMRICPGFPIGLRPSGMTTPIVSAPSLSGEGAEHPHRPEKCEAVFGSADAQKMRGGWGLTHLPGFVQTPPGRALLRMRVHPPLKGREVPASATRIMPGRRVRPFGRPEHTPFAGHHESKGAVIPAKAGIQRYAAFARIPDPPSARRE